MLFKPVKRLSKRQIKEDKLVTAIAETWDWIQANYSKLIGGAIGLVALIYLAIYMMGRGERRNVEAAEAFSKVQIAAMEGRMGDVLIQGEEVYKKYEGAGAGAQALLLVANSLFEMGRLGEARKAFQKCRDDYRKDPLLVYAGWNGLAACLEQEGNLRGAAAQYEAFAQKYPDSPFAPSALKEASRCYGHAGDRDRERAFLQRIADTYKNSAVGLEAQTRLKAM